MQENLRVRHYNDGTPVPNITVNAYWSSLSYGARNWYENDSAGVAGVYGALYNWYAVNDTLRLCPEGWRVPTDAEWNVLTLYLGGENLTGGALKDTSALWFSPNTGATNQSGFTARPGASFSSNGFPFGKGYRGNWWSSSSTDANSAWSSMLNYNNSQINRHSNHMRNGFSVRCIKDN